MEEEYHKEVIEKVLECIRDLAEEMGPAGIADYIDWIVTQIELLLDKEAPCQKGRGGEGEDEENPEEEEADS